MNEKSFFNYLFIDRSEEDDLEENVLVIDEIMTGDSDAPKNTSQNVAKPRRRSSKLHERVAAKAILQINKIVAIICVLSFIAIIVFPMIKVTLPEVISNTFSMTLGYFGSALITFLEKQSKTS